jgi:oligoendopeptidase F
MAVHIWCDEHDSKKTRTTVPQMSQRYFRQLGLRLKRLEVQLKQQAEAALQATLSDEELANRLHFMVMEARMFKESGCTSPQAQESLRNVAQLERFMGIPLVNSPPPA